MALSMKIDCTPTAHTTNHAFMHLRNQGRAYTTDGFAENGPNAQAVISFSCLIPMLKNMYAGRVAFLPTYLWASIVQTCAGSTRYQ